MMKFIKQEIVLVISFVFALVSCFFVTPSKAYIDYIDFRTLALLFSLMAVVVGLTESGVTDKASNFLMGKCKNLTSVFLVLVLLPFFAAMIVTNDVALITFVPFGIGVMNSLKQKKTIIPLVVIQTIAANMGSVLTPIGNPQNLYIQSNYNLSASSFVITMLPVWIISLILVGVMSLVVCRINKNKIEITDNNNGIFSVNKITLVRSLLALVMCILTVFHVVDYKITLMAVVVILFGKIFLKVDYALLVTFVCFFIFSGNVAQISQVRDFITGFVQKSSFISSLLLSQVISNVPAAVFLSSFTEDWKGLLMGVDVGGLGTPVASLASLISMKFYIKAEDADVKKYMLVFTSLNLIGIAILCLFRILVP